MNLEFLIHKSFTKVKIFVPTKREEAKEKEDFDKNHNRRKKQTSNNGYIFLTVIFSLTKGKKHWNIQRSDDAT